MYLSFFASILSNSIFVNTNKKQKAKFDFWNLLFQFLSANDQILKKRFYRVKCNFRNAPFRTTILVLGSMLDTFQKIADAASNTRGKKFTPFLSWSLYVVFTTFGRGCWPLEQPRESNENRRLSDNLKSLASNLNSQKKRQHSLDALDKISSNFCI